MTSPKSYKNRKEITIPDHISDRILPALPIKKRNLPSLNQSQSDYFELATVGCSSPRTNRSSTITSNYPSIYIPPLPRARTLTLYTTTMSPHSALSPRASMLAARKSIKNTVKTSVKWFKSKTKLLDYSDINSINNIPENIPKSKWRPSLQFIYDDTELLPALITFMRKQYNEENILFLISVEKLNDKIDTLLLNDKHIYISDIKQKQINFEIIAIYNEFIVNNAAKQVNLSYNCFIDIMSIKDRFISFNLNDKKCIFNNCVSEIEKLIKLSILNGFYASDNFNIIAYNRPLPPPISIDIKSNNISCLSLDDLNINSNISNISNISSNYTSRTGCTSTLSTADEYEIRTPECGDNTPNTPMDSYEYSSINFNIFNSISERDLNNNGNKYMISSNGFIDGYHEWKIKIININSEFRHEIGIVSTINNKINVSRFGICDTPLFGARVIYGCNNNEFYYSSYGKGNKQRCHKDLTKLNVHQNGWKNGDIIKICLNLNKGNIKFYLNDKKIRRTLSVEKRIKYYPFVGFTENCPFKTL